MGNFPGYCRPLRMHRDHRRCLSHITVLRLRLPHLLRPHPRSDRHRSPVSLAASATGASSLATASLRPPSRATTTGRQVSYTPPPPKPATPEKGSRSSPSEPEVPRSRCGPKGPPATSLAVSLPCSQKKKLARAMHGRALRMRRTSHPGRGQVASLDKVFRRSPRSPPCHLQERPKRLPCGSATRADHPWPCRSGADRSSRPGSRGCPG